MRYLEYLLKFLDDEKTVARKLVEAKENHSFLKTLERQKQKKTSQEEDRAIADLNEWNPTLLKFFDGLSESTVEQRSLLRKFYLALEQLVEEFEKIADNYKAFVKKHTKLIARKLEQVEDNSRAQKKALSRYYYEQKRYAKDPTAAIADVKLVQAQTNQQAQLMSERGEEIRRFVEELVQYEAAINNSFKERFGVFLAGEEAVFRLTTRLMALPKLIERIDTEQAAVKGRYFQQHIVCEQTLARVKSFSGFLEADALVAVTKYLSLSAPVLLSLFAAEQAAKEFLDHAAFRRLNVELSEGWIVESWTRCQGFVTFDDFLLLFGEGPKPLRVINVRNAKLESRQDDVILLNEGKKGLFGTSSEEYKIRFLSANSL